MSPISRLEQFNALFPEIQAFRRKQFVDVLFQPKFKNWEDVSVFSREMREKLQTNISWMSLTESLVQGSTKQDTYKALLETSDGKQIETVLMENRRGWWTICVSSQVGCAMKCSFCSTGKMGLTRNLLADEIIDQYRYWVQFLHEHPELPDRITNIVFMGMGEPMANYENVRESIRTILEQTDLGQTRITVSTVGMIPRLDLLINDPLWQHVRLAISLHSADPKTRKEIVPSSYDDFIPKLIHWSQRYLEKFGNRRHHLTFEYVMLNGINDTPRHAEQLAKMIHRIGNIRVNLIPYNFTGGEFQTSSPKTIRDFFEYLDAHGVTVTKRKTMGEDIDAACGQLYASTNK